MTHHQFHVDQAGHSITVNLRSGHPPEIELLVDGKELDYHHERLADSVTLTGELPSTPPQPFSVRVDHVHHRARRAVCTLITDVDERVMPERAMA
ncbi:hypothetical protein [Streptacidiphilus sp. EB129]|uniref:hypothetical protein n=1 Tax=Streptacidiphilus sp. EB129 TaxID=3156262 RepID=UPI0035152713